MTLVPLRRNVLTDARGARAGEATLARRYKLRLSDGTILAVDFEGLTVWLMDKKAMVQVAGSREWRPLKEVIAEVRVAAKYAEREKRQAREQEKEQKKSEKKRGGRDALPLVPPPDKAGGPPPEAPVTEGVSAEEARIGAPQDIQTLADDPVMPAAGQRVDDSPAIPLKPLEGDAPLRVEPPTAGPDEPIGVADEPIGVADEPLGVADAPEHADDGGFVGAFIDDEPDTRPPEPAPVLPSPEPSPPIPAPEAPATADSSIVADVDPSASPGLPQPSDDDVSRLIDSLDGARVDEALLGSPPDVAALPDDPVLAAPSAPETPSIPEPPVASGDPVAPVAPSAPASAGEPSPVASTEDVAIGAPLGVTSLADDPTPSPREDPPPHPAPTPEPPPVVPSPPVEAPPAAPEPPARVRVVVRDPVTRSAPSAGPDAALPAPEPPVPRSPQPLADDVTEPAASRARGAQPPADRLPVVPMKRLDGDRPAAGAAPDSSEGAEDPGGLGAMLLAALGAVGALFSRILEPITRLERGEPLVDDEAPPVLGPSVEKLRTTATGWAGGVRERAAGMVDRARAARAEAAARAAHVDSEPSTGVSPSGGEDTPSRLASTLQSTTSALSSWVGALVERVRDLWPAGGEEVSSPSDPDPTPSSRREREEEASSISPVALRVEPLAASIAPDEVPGPERHEVPEPGPEARPEPVAPTPPTPTPRPPLEIPTPSPARSEAPAPTPAPRLTAPPLEQPPSAPPPPSPPVSRRVPAPPPVPPPSTDALEVVPLAEPIARSEPEDVYDEGEDGAGDLLQAAWGWAKLLVAIGLVGAVVAFAAVNWRTWFPKAAEIGEATFTEVDRVARSAERAEQLRKAVEDATPELPHLAPRTIRLVMSSSTTALPEPSEVFRIAGDAADRGLGTLSVEEARELEALHGELRDGLGPLEQEQLEGYARTRARRIVFPEEHTHALALVARGARTLPPERRQRLQEILAKAVAAGLGPPGPRGGTPLADDSAPETR